VYDRHLRAKELGPSVLVTLISIIQALSLEVLWNALGEQAHLWHGGWAAWIGWCQVAAVLCGIALVWVFYTTIVMRFVWLPNVRDSVIPFVLGLGEFVLADLLEPEWLSVWFLVMAGVFAYSTWASYLMFQSAASEPENVDFFQRNQVRMRDMWIPEAFFAVAMAGFGGIVSLLGPAGWPALACMVLTLGILFVQLDQIRRYWNLTMFPDEEMRG
jgi:hypothetical protein